MTYSDAIEFLYSLRWFGAKFGLENTFRLAELAGNPQHKLRFIHVAGTNGKGSTCAMLESIYRAAGLKVGLFTSPHLVSFGERIQINREPISEAAVVNLVERMQGLLKRGWPDSHTGAQSSSAGVGSQPIGAGAPRSGADHHPTFFEVVTVLALSYFAEHNCDLVIWETGLGGRLDATNIVTPMASVITNIQYDHQQWLGYTLEKIAAEKAGIIKPGIPVITATDSPEALRVIEETSRRQTAPLTIVPPNEPESKLPNGIKLPLLGQHQRLNAELAVATVRLLAAQIPVSDEALRKGLSNVQWAGRLQLVTGPSGQKILLDGAHNIAGAETLVAALKQYFPSAKATFILGILRDKDWSRVCQIFTPYATRMLLVPVASERSATPQELAGACRDANDGGKMLACESLKQALAETLQDEFVVVAGSLYLVGEAMELLNLSPAKCADERGLNEWSVGNKASSVKLPA
jgi:dihydrofolate synthase/folylpolyglutamate synthase